MTHTTDKLREEWRNNGFWTGDSIDKDLIPTEVMDKIADWWLSKLETTLKDREERIRNMLIRHGYGPELRDAEAKEAQEDAYRNSENK